MMKRCLAFQCIYNAAPHKRSDDATHPRYRHRCGVAQFPFCIKYVPQDTHQCYIQPLKDDRKLLCVPESEVGDGAILGLNPETGGCYVEENVPLFVYADYEATTDAQGVQSPILLCCESEDEANTFYSADYTEAFFDYLDKLTIDKYGDSRKVIIIFHNFNVYNGMFVLKYLYDNHHDVQDQITIGTKVLSLGNHDLIFKDSLYFLPFPLASFPATFGLTEQCKGFFPHLFNTVENQQYEGPIPEAHFYDPDGMSGKKKAKFLRWHADKVQSNYVFNLRLEMETYCISDVKLLKAGCQKFQQEFESHSEFKPMDKCITIASACNRFWHKKLLPPDTIAIEPPLGWFGAQSNTSVVAHQWLAYENHRLRTQNAQPDLVYAGPIQTATNRGEVRVYTPAQSYLVDGLDTNTNTVCEFHGCLWHGCPTCFPHRSSYSKLKSRQDPPRDVRGYQKKRKPHPQQQLQNKIMWECQWKTKSATLPPIIEFLKTWQPVPPLNPRHAFFGGCTNACCLYYVIDPATGEKTYVNVTSLYPWVNAEGEYPVGHPEVITNPDDQDIANYFGVALNDVIPPHKLYHPVLLHCQGGKLTFPLCAKCVAEEMQKPMLERSCVCRHNDEERMLRGTWCTPELLKAREKGYRIVRIHKVWHFRHRIKGLFKDYANQWLKVKQESSGYPAWVDTDTITRRIKASISTQTRSPKMPYRFGTDTHDRVTTTACTGTTTQ